MKKVLGFLILVILIFAGCYIYVPADESGSRPPGESPYEPERGPYGRYDVSFFYDQLDPYGAWISYAPYGYVWIPGDVGYRWRPYTRGHWVWTDYGWTWVSLESWGWIAYHYGRWGWDRRIGWFWVPDIVWGPAWVAWRWGDLHIGWAPLPPGAEFVSGMGFRRRDFDIPGHHWNFVRGRDFMDRSLDRWILPSERNLTVINLTVYDINIRVQNNRVFNEGMGLDRVRRMTSQPIEAYRLRDARQPGGAKEEGRDLVIYKPDVSRNETARPKRFLEKEQAVERLDSESPGRVLRKPTTDEAGALRKLHEQEQRLMDESQQSEVGEIRRKADQEKVKIRNPGERQKIEEETKTKIAELKKKHETEKADLAKRQKDEEDKTKRGTVRKKDKDKN